MRSTSAPPTPASSGPAMVPTSTPVGAPIVWAAISAGVVNVVCPMAVGSTPPTAKPPGVVACPIAPISVTSPTVVVPIVGAVMLVKSGVSGAPSSSILRVARLPISISPIPTVGERSSAVSPARPNSPSIALPLRPPLTLGIIGVVSLGPGMPGIEPGGLPPTSSQVKPNRVGSLDGSPSSRRRAKSARAASSALS